MATLREVFVPVLMATDESCPGDHNLADLRRLSCSETRMEAVAALARAIEAGAAANPQLRYGGRIETVFLPA